jgi:hypothetical protein
LISFQNYSSDRQDSGPKKCFHEQNLGKLSPELFKFSGAANGRLRLADEGTRPSNSYTSVALEYGFTVLVL